MRCAMFALLLILATVCSAFAEVRDFKVVTVKTEDVYQLDLKRMRANVVVTNAYLLPRQDLIDTAKAAAKKMYDESRMQVIVIKLYPNKEYAEFFPQFVDLTYAPEGRGWDGKPAAKWVGYIADRMPDEKEMFKINSWVVENSRNKKTILDSKKDLAKQMELPVEDTFFPIFSLVPCLMDNES